MKKHGMLEYNCGEGIAGTCLWFRVFGYGLHFKRNGGRLLFSERMGITKCCVIFGIRVKVLKP